MFPVRNLQDAGIRSSFLVNGRNMRHPYIFHKAIVGCYESLIAPDTQQYYFLKFTVDPQSVDVNRSPTKMTSSLNTSMNGYPSQAAVKAALRQILRSAFNRLHIGR